MHTLLSQDDDDDIMVEMAPKNEPTLESLRSGKAFESPIEAGINELY